MSSKLHFPTCLMYIKNNPSDFAMGQHSNVCHNLIHKFGNLALPKKNLPKNDSRIFVTGFEEHLAERCHAYNRSKFRSKIKDKVQSSRIYDGSNRTI